MEELVKIQGLRWCTEATIEQVQEIMEAMRKNDSKELALMPSPQDPDVYIGFLLAKYATPALSHMLGVCETMQDDDFQFLVVSKAAARGFLSSLMRKIYNAHVKKDTPPAVSQTESFDGLLTQAAEGSLPELDEAPPIRRRSENPRILDFLKRETPALIERELNRRVIGQPALAKAVADFIYYHALRQLHPELPQRPLLISGPSGSGKTEVWRVANYLYGKTIPIKIIDGSTLTCEGWAGNYKIDTFMDGTMTSGGILVVDEFDKLARPKYSSGNENVSLAIQSEFLKLLEGEYQVTEKKKQTNITSRKMGFVLVGAFEGLRQEKKEQRTTPRVGFCVDTPVLSPDNACDSLTDEDFIGYGIMPEVVGRIATKCATVPLSDEAYMDIIRGPHSRVGRIEQTLKQYGVEVSDVISSQELKAMIAASKSNRTGVRWVSAQVETRLLEAIREHGLFHNAASHTAA